MLCACLGSDLMKDEFRHKLHASLSLFSIFFLTKPNVFSFLL
jgi:hypothetical protein